jgi:hypothetical protein
MMQSPVSPSSMHNAAFGSIGSLQRAEAPAALDHSRALPQGDGVPGQRSHAAR